LVEGGRLLQVNGVKGRVKEEDFLKRAERGGRGRAYPAD